MDNNFDIFRKFIVDNEGADMASLRLKYAGREVCFRGFSALDQIEARKKTKSKLSSFIAHEEFIFPSTLSAEQASNEAVARFHASLFSKDECIADLTAGLGIDVFSIARRVSGVTAFERFKTYSDALSHNADILDIHNVTVINADSIQWLTTHDDYFSSIFIDPARRGRLNKRTFALEDCEPDILANFSLLASRAGRMLVKCSPMLDIKEVIRSVPSLRRIYVVSFSAECKEILLEIIPHYSSPAEIILVSISRQGDVITYPFAEGDVARSPDKFVDMAEIYYTSDALYIYEPDPALMKIAPWKALVSTCPQLKKIAPDTHLFITRDSTLPFPGRIVRIISPLDKRQLRQLKGHTLNVVARNSPMSAPQIISKYGLNTANRQTKTSGLDGKYLYCFRDSASRLHFLLTSLTD